MELNLDRLNSLSFADFPTEKPKKQAPEKPQETILTPTEYKTLPNANKPAEELTGAYTELQLKAYAVRGKKETVKLSSQLQAEILKGIQAGEDIYKLFLKATEAIGIISHDKLFYEQTERDIKAVYGYGLREKAPLLIELEETQKRLKNLMEAEQRETEHENRHRIRTAINAHRKKVAELKALITESEI